MRAPKSEFLAWFVGQFGKRPSRKPVWKLRDKMNSMKAAAARAEMAYLEALVWEKNHTAALYAWNARTKKASPDAQP